MQPDEKCPVTQPRIKFIPTADEIAEHLRLLRQNTGRLDRAIEALRASDALPFMEIRPLNVELDLTSRCNQRCIMCYLSHPPDSFRGQADPAAQMLVVGEGVENGLVRSGDVGRVAGECAPAEWALPFAKQRSDIFGHESLEIEGVFDADLYGLASDIVAVVEGDRPAFSQFQH